MIFINKEERKLFSLLVADLRPKFPILTNYKEPTFITKRKFNQLLKCYIQFKEGTRLSKHPSKCKIPLDFQTSGARLNFLI